MALESNANAADSVPETFVDHAELVWRLLDGRTQLQVAELLGWSRGRVSQYAMLKGICSQAWDVIATTFEEPVASVANDAVAEVATPVATTFTENLLRPLSTLYGHKQYQFVRDLARGKDRRGHRYDKRTFNCDIDESRKLNDALAHTVDRLTDVIDDAVVNHYLAKALMEISRWCELREEREKLDSYLDRLLDEYRRQSSWLLIQKEIGALTSDDIPDESVDVIITDPPYPKEYIGLFGDLAVLAERVLKPGGSLVVMCGQAWLPKYIELLSEHLEYQWTLAYHTPGGQAVQVWSRDVISFFKPILWFAKGKPSNPWISDHISTAVNSNDKAHHHWGQSENGMASIVERFSKGGDVVCDPFVGGGTTGVVCVSEGRRFVGADRDRKAIQTAKARIEALLNGVD